jgi:amino acid adenylation domain-containing protein/non-ribosomal peptide synthase protein (TIGR01720 family)
MSNPTVEGYRLSPQQRHLWLLQQAGQSQPYRVQSLTRLQGNLNRDRLESAIRRVVGRHEILRTRFATLSELAIPLQVIAEVEEFSILDHDWTGLNTQQLKFAIENLFQEESRLSFDFAYGPTLRLSLVTLSKESHLLLISLPALCADTTTLNNFTREISHFYTAWEQDEWDGDAPTQYADVSEVLNELLEAEDTEAGREHWRRLDLSGLFTVELPFEKTLLQLPEFAPRFVTRALPAEQVAKMRAFVKESETSTEGFLLACWLILLRRLVSHQELIVGNACDGRAYEGLKDVFGLFAKYLPLHVLMEEESQFAHLLKQVHQATSEAYRWQEYFDWQAVGLTANGIGQSFFPFCFDFQQQQETYAGAGIQFSVEEQYACIDRFKVKLSCVEKQGLLSVAFHYDSILFDTQNINQLATQFQTLFQSVTNNVQTRLWELEILGDDERRQLLVVFNQVKVTYPTDQCLSQRFEQQVARTPDRIALVFEGKQMSYATLNARANQLAHYLNRLGVEPGNPVAICFERCLDTVVGILGILKAGAAYVPLDPAYPTQRLSFTLADALVPVLMTQEHLIERLPQAGAMQVICLDRDQKAIARESSQNPDLNVSPENPAYVIYTSGSTGKPKGVIVTHANVTRLFDATHLWFEADDKDVWTLFHSYAFDFSVWEIWGALLYGGRLVIVSYLTSRTPEAFYELLASENVTVLNQTPSAFRQLMRVEDRHDWQRELSLRYVIFGGEALELQSLRPWFELHGEQKPQLVNMYGITETTVHVTYRPLQESDLSSGAGSVIGEAIPDLQLLVLDDYLQPLPVGVAGEIYVGGAGVAQGYLNQPEMTAMRFIPNPYSKDEGARLYKTGDLARYLAGGELEYMGRADQQVKVHGYRIELGEIEAAIMEHTAIRESLVTASSEAGGERRLVGYVVLKGGHRVTTGEIRAYLKETLPDYMVPSAFVIMETFPLTPNGKVDRRALPPADQSRSDFGDSFVAPLTPVEKQLASIWSEVLRVDHVGINDNFFEMGGDSILGIQVTVRANQIGLGLSPKHIFEHQTIARLATVAGSVAAVESEQEEITGFVPLTPIQRWFFEQDLSDSHYFNQALLLDCRQQMIPAFLEQSIAWLLRHHDALRLRFIHTEHDWQQFCVPYDGVVPFSRLDVSGLAEAEQKIVIETTARQLQTSLNLSRGPLLRATFFDLGEQRSSRLLLVIHHLAVDGITWQILLDDLHTVYQQLSRGESPALPLKTTSFQRWAQVLAEYAQSAELRQESGYWLSHSHARISRLPVDDTQGVNTVASTATVRVTLSAEETRHLLVDVPKAYNTQINDLLLAALAQALSRWTENSLLLIDLESHGREEIASELDLSRTAGWFTTVFPVWLDLEGNSDAGEMIKRVKEQLRNLPNRGIGYGVLRYLSPDAEIRQQLRALPQAEVIFNYLGQLDRAVAEESPFRPARESSGSTRSPQARRAHLLEITGSVIGGRLQLSWTYNENIHQRSTIEEVAGDFLSSLQLLIAHCLSSQAGGYTPSDFAKVTISQKELDALVAKRRLMAPGDSEKKQIEDIYPLSPLQQGMLFHTVYAPQAGMFLNQISCTLHGDLDLSALQRSWQHVVERHSVLRTAFIWNQLGEPLQVVYKSAPVELEESDWRHMAVAEQQQSLNDFLREDRRQGFELSNAPLMRLFIIRTGQEDYRFVWTHHHLLLDGWSVSLLFKEVLACYEAFRHERRVQLDPARLYGDYIDWLQRQELSAAEAFWRERLKGFTTPTLLAIEAAKGRLSNQKPDYDEQRSELPVASKAALQNLARQHQLTLNTLVQGAWALLLSRYSGQQDVVFGAVASIRPPDLHGIESMIGPFINTLPVRVNIKQEMQLLSWLKELQEQQFKQRQYEYSPLTQIHQWSELPGGLALFESVLVFENYPVEATLRGWEGGLKIGAVRALERSNYPLNLVVTPGPTLRLFMPYDRNRFSSSMISRLLRQFQILLKDMTEQPHRRVSEFRLIEEEEKAQLIQGFNDEIETC